LGTWGLTMGYIIRVVRKGANETHLGVLLLLLALTIVCM